MDTIQNYSKINSSPHITRSVSVNKIMWQVIFALSPAIIAALYYFHFSALRLMLVCTLSAIATEYFINRLRQKKNSLGDGSAIITGLLLALTLPPSFSSGGGMLGSIVAIGLGKQVFGGLGYNIFNPALFGRAFLQASYPVAITTWTLPLSQVQQTVDGITAATPLGLHKFEAVSTALTPLMSGNTGGSLGETSAIAILLGGLYLLIRKYADWRIPLSMTLSVIIFGGIFWIINPGQYPNPLFHLFSGGLMLGMFFMATDMVTSPITAKGSVIFGAGIGFLVILIRLFGGLPEGVMYAILLMNAVTPLINRYTKPKIFGEK